MFVYIVDGTLYLKWKKWGGGGNRGYIDRETLIETYTSMLKA